MEKYQEKIDTNMGFCANEVIHCRTREQAKRVFELAEEMGRASAFMNKSVCIGFKTDTCYSLCDDVELNLENAIWLGFGIIPAKAFIKYYSKLNPITNQELKEMKGKRLNLVNKLGRCPNGTKLYSTIYGEVELSEIKECDAYPIVFENKVTYGVTTSDGRQHAYCNGECTLFSSPEKLSWDLFHYAKEKEYVTVISLNRKGKEMKYTCQVSKDCVFDPENSKVLKSKGVIGKRLVEVRASTQEEINSIKGELVKDWKKGDILVCNNVTAVFDRYEGKDSFIASVTYSTGTNLVNRDFKCKIKAFSSASEKEKEDFTEWLRDQQCGMINESGKLVRWQPLFNGMYFCIDRVSRGCGNVTRYIRSSENLYRVQLNDENVFPTYELAKKTLESRPYMLILDS